MESGSSLGWRGLDGGDVELRLFRREIEVGDGAAAAGGLSRSRTRTRKVFQPEARVDP